jgi:hypothetical protein
MDNKVLKEYINTKLIDIAESRSYMLFVFQKKDGKLIGIKIKKECKLEFVDIKELKKKE